MHPLPSCTAHTASAVTAAAFLTDLKHAVGDIEASGKSYAIVPDVAGWRPSAAQPNPLAVDWAYPMETPSPVLQAELTSSLDEQRGKLIALVQKVSAERLHKRFKPLDSSYCTLLEHVCTSWNKTGETWAVTPVLRFQRAL